MSNDDVFYRGGGLVVSCHGGYVWFDDDNCDSVGVTLEQLVEIIAALDKFDPDWRGIAEEKP